MPDKGSAGPRRSEDAGKLERQLERLLEGLEACDRKVLIWRFGLRGKDAHTLQEIGEALGVSRERVRQIEAGALSKLRPKVPSLGLYVLLEGPDRKPMPEGARYSAAV